MQAEGLGGRQLGCVDDQRAQAKVLENLAGDGGREDGGYVKRAMLGAMGALLLQSGCETITATRLATPRARVDECEKLCSDVGMKLGAFVVMMNSAGCVREPTKAERASTSSSRGATAVGAATIAAIEEAQRQQRQHQQRQSQASSYHR